MFPAILFLMNLHVVKTNELISQTQCQRKKMNIGNGCTSEMSVATLPTHLGNGTVFFVRICVRKTQEISETQKAAVRTNSWCAQWRLAMNGIYMQNPLWDEH